MNHALLTRNILETGSTAVASVCTSGLPHPVVSCSFYPLAADVSWAQAAALTGGRLGVAMTAWAASSWARLPGGHRLRLRPRPGRPPLVAGAAATATTVVGPLYASMLTGRVPEQAGPCLSVGVALLAALAVRSAHPVRLGLLAGLGAAGIVLTHSYDVLFAASLAVGLALVMRATAVSPARRHRGRRRAGHRDGRRRAVPADPARGRRRARRHPAAAARTAGPGVRLLGERPAALRGARLPRPGWRPSSAADAAGAGRPCGPSSPACSPRPSCLLLDRLRWARPWLFAYVLWTAVGIWTSSSDSPAAMLLSGLWYGTRERVRTMILPVYGVLAVAGRLRARHRGAPLAGAALRRVARRRAGPARVASVGPRPPRSAPCCWPARSAAVALLPTPAARCTPTSRGGPGRGVVPRTFAWLARSTPPGSVARTTGTWR